MISYGWVLTAGFVGVLIGIFITALMAANRDKPQIDPDSVAIWLLKMSPIDREKVMLHLVKRVFHATWHLHRNPVKRKPVIASGDTGYDFGKEIPV